MAAKALLRSRALKYGVLFILIGGIVFMGLHSYVTHPRIVVQDETLAFIYVEEELQPNRNIKNTAYQSLSDCSSDDKIFATISGFNRMMNSLKVESVLIEPILLYCMLPLKEKALLQKHRFKLEALKGLPNVIHFAVMDNNLLLSNLTPSQVPQNFRQWKVRGNPGTWFKQQKASQDEVVLHHFFERSNVVIHAVVFLKRQDYFWHSNLPDKLPEELEKLGIRKSLLYSSFNSVYDKFESMPVVMDEFETFSLHIPSRPAHFLKQIASSKMIECHPSRSLNSTIKAQHKGRYEALVHAFKDSLSDLKENLDPFLIDFVICGGTLLGWYRECDIIPYTTDVDYSAFAADAEHKKFWIKMFHNQSRTKMYITMMMGLPDEAFEFAFRTRKSQQRVDLFFLYEGANNTLWVSGHYPSQGYYLKYVYPKFEVCSAELLGHKVNLPCKPEEVIMADYGSEWDKHISSWNYLSSPKNLGPKVYWSQDERPNTYREFS